MKNHKWSKLRSRNCSDPEPKFGGICEPDEEGNEHRKETFCKPIDGRWSEWIIQEDSEKNCVNHTNGRWYKSKKRNCSDPEAKFGGKSCEGKGTDPFKLKDPWHNGQSP